MSQTLFASNSTPSMTLLDQNFTQLYALRELISDPAYTAATMKASFNASGYFGIATTAHVNPFQVSLIAGAGTPYVAVNQVSDAPIVEFQRWSGAGSNFGGVRLKGVGGNVFTIETAPDAVVGSQTFTECLRFDASRNALFGTTATTPNPGVAIIPTGAVNIGNTAQASGWVFTSFNRSGTGIGSITQSGTTAVLYNTTSDRRLKKNIRKASGAGEIIDGIKVRAFDWRGSEESVTHGFIAQELHEVAPYAVKVGGNKRTDPWAVDPSKLVALLVKEVQDLRARVAALEA